MRRATTASTPSTVPIQQRRGKLHHVRKPGNWSYSRSPTVRLRRCPFHLQGTASSAAPITTRDGSSNNASELDKGNGILEGKVCDLCTTMKAYTFVQVLPSDVAADLMAYIIWDYI